MKPSYSLLLLAAAAIFLASTGFQCGSAEITSAKLYMQQKQWDKAEQSLTKELAKNDKNEEAWFLLGQARLEQKNYAGMNEAYTRALELGNTHQKEIQQNKLAIWANLYNEGVSMYNKGKDDPAQYDKSLQNFNTAIDLMPDSSTTYYVAALTHYAKKDYEGATKRLEQALVKNPQSADAAKFLGQIKYQQASEAYARGDSAAAHAELMKAAGAFEKAYKADPSSAENITNLIDVYDRTKQSDKAMQLTEEAIKRDPNNKIYRYASGVFLLKQDKFAESTEQFKKALEIEPTYTDATYNLGVAYLNWGVSMKAESDKKAEEAAAKGNKSFKEDLSYKDKYREAIPYLEKAAEQRADDAILWQQLGKIYMNLNMKDKAEKAFARYDQITKGK
jgi:tetratricopeptide (TPR) repeat protein